MLAFLGDIHGDPDILKVRATQAKEAGAVALIQVGDFGWYTGTIPRFRFRKYDLPIYFIDGNHEDHGLLRAFKTITEVCDGVFFVPRGTVLELDGRRVAFCGGAASVDKSFRIRQKLHWSDEENIRDEEIARLNDVENIDILTTHVPPQSVIRTHFDPRTLLYFELPITWIDENAVKIERLWAELKYPQIFCGHMHKGVTDNKCRILDINEMVLL